MEDYSKDLSKLIQDAVDKAKEIGGITKLHAMIKAEEAKKQEQYYRLGRKYYELYKDTPEMELVDFVDKLAACDAKIKEYKKQIKKEQEASYKDVYKTTMPAEAPGTSERAASENTSSASEDSAFGQETEVCDDVEVVTNK